jgi:2-oxo-3-hexenedioate decarboxylase
MPDAATQWTEDSVARELAAAERGRREITRFTLAWEDLDLEAAYRIQGAGIRARITAGRHRVGVKLGLTSVAKQRQMGVSAPLVGILTDDMALVLGEPLHVDELIHPRVEPEIAFVMGADLVGPGATADDARAAVATVHAGIEVIDSRYRDFDFRLADVVADNASSARFVIDPVGLDPAGLDLVAEAVALSIDGGNPATATGAAVMGDPYAALALAANDLAGRADRIRAGEIVLSGALTDARTILPGQIASVAFTRLGSLALRAV